MAPGSRRPGGASPLRRAAHTAPCAHGALAPGSHPVAALCPISSTRCQGRGPGRSPLRQGGPPCHQGPAQPSRLQPAGAAHCPQEPRLPRRLRNAREKVGAAAASHSSRKDTRFFSCHVGSKQETLGALPGSGSPRGAAGGHCWQAEAEDKRGRSEPAEHRAAVPAGETLGRQMPAAPPAGLPDTERASASRMRRHGCRPDGAPESPLRTQRRTELWATCDAFVSDQLGNGTSGAQASGGVRIIWKAC